MEKKFFTFHSPKASVPVYKRVLKSKWNWILILGIALAVFELFREGLEVAACATIFWGSWVLVHRYIVAFKNIQIEGLIDVK